MLYYYNTLEQYFKKKSDFRKILVESMIWLNGFWLMMMMMTIYFTEATRLLESSGSAVSVPQEEEQQCKMCNEQ